MSAAARRGGCSQDALAMGGMRDVPGVQASPDAQDAQTAHASPSFGEMRFVLAGFGGQGVLFAGKVIAYAGLIEDREVSWMPSYGPEMRGGTANCNVTVSDEPIGSPLVLDPTVLVALNQPSLDKFEDAVVPNGLIVYDSSLSSRAPLRTDVRVAGIPAAKLAEDAGLSGLANIVCIGRVFAETGFCRADALERALRKAVPARRAALVEGNLKALALGRAFDA